MFVDFAYGNGIVVCGICVTKEVTKDINFELLLSTKINFTKYLFCKVSVLLKLYLFPILFVMEVYAFFSEHTL